MNFCRRQQMRRADGTTKALEYELLSSGQISSPNTNAAKPNSSVRFGFLAAPVRRAHKTIVDTPRVIHTTRFEGAIHA